jgi:hypothetical protein
MRTAFSGQAKDATFFCPYIDAQYPQQQEEQLKRSKESRYIMLFR